MKKSTGSSNKGLLALFFGITAGFMFLAAVFTSLVRDVSDDVILVAVSMVAISVSVIFLTHSPARSCRAKVSPNHKHHE